MLKKCSTVVPNKHLWISYAGSRFKRYSRISFTFANAIEYINTCVSRGLKVDEFAPRLSFFFCCTMEFFEEVAKFRAARRIYAKIMNERFGAKSDKSTHLRFHVQTSGESLTAQQVDNNIVRVTSRHFQQ